MDTDMDKDKETGKEEKKEFEEKLEFEEKHESEEKERTQEKNSESEEIFAEWAEALHLEYDPEEARRRAEKAAGPVTPPPAPIPNLVHNPAPSPYPFNQQPPIPPASGFNNQEPMPDTYLVWSVLATVLCCLIPGIVAIVYSTMVSSKYYAKDYEGARRASENAQYWIIASVVLGVITAAVYIPLSLFA